MSVLSMCFWVCTTCVPGAQGAQKRVLDTWNWSNRQLGATLCFVGSEPGSLAKTASTFSCRGPSL